MKKLIATAALMAAAWSVPAFSADYAIDKTHTMVFFTIDHLGFSKSTGQFTDFDGKFSFDEKTPEASTVEVTMNVDSLDLANNEKWSNHIKGEDYFNVKEYPTATFKSTGVTKNNDKTLAVAGELTLLGKTKSVVLDVTFNKAGTVFGRELAGFSATTTIDRTDFGMDKSVPHVGAEVELRLEVEGEKL